MRETTEDCEFTTLLLFIHYCKSSVHALLAQFVNCPLEPLLFPPWDVFPCTWAIHSLSLSFSPSSPDCIVHCTHLFPRERWSLVYFGIANNLVTRDKCKICKRQGCFCIVFFLPSSLAFYEHRSFGLRPLRPAHTVSSLCPFLFSSLLSLSISPSPSPFAHSLISLHLQLVVNTNKEFIAKFLPCDPYSPKLSASLSLSFMVSLVLSLPLFFLLFFLSLSHFRRFLT